MWCWTGSADLIFWFYSWFICFCSTSHYDAALNNKPLISGRIFRSPVAYTKGMTGLAADEPQGVIREPIELCLLLSGHRHGPIRLCFQFFRTQSFIFFFGFCITLWTVKKCVVFPEALAGKRGYYFVLPSSSYPMVSCVPLKEERQQIQGKMRKLLYFSIIFSGYFESN